VPQEEGLPEGRLRPRVNPPRRLRVCASSALPATSRSGATSRHALVGPTHAVSALGFGWSEHERLHVGRRAAVVEGGDYTHAATGESRDCR
jgi:hypothetical protein